MYDEKMNAGMNGDQNANPHGAFAADDIGYQYTSNGTQYGHYRIPEPEQMTKQQKKARAKVEKATKKAQRKRMKAEQKRAWEEQGKIRNRYPLGKRMLASALCGILFAGTAFATLYGIEKYTNLTILVDGKQASSGQIPVAGVALGHDDAGSVAAADEENSNINLSTNGNAQSTMNGTTLATDVTQVVKSVMPAIVSIENEYLETMNYFGQSFSQPGTSSGSGIIVGTNDTELLIATNYHVIESTEQLTVTFIDETTATADVKGTDSENDLAIIAVQLDTISADTRSSIAVAKLGDSDALQVGEPVIAIGNALGYGQSVTTGVVSAVNRQVEGVGDLMIQTDAAINPGNSGGALLNARGEVIGINSAKIGGNTVEGMGYAIPISYAEPIMEELMVQSTKIKVADDEKGYLGISGVNVGSEVSQAYKIPQGVYVYQVYEGTAAEAAGLKQGDVITALNGASVGNMEALQRELQYYSIGTTVELTVMRAADGYQEETVELVLGGKFDAD